MIAWTSGWLVRSTMSVIGNQRFSHASRSPTMRGSRVGCLPSRAAKNAVRRSVPAVTASSSKPCAASARRTCRLPAPIMKPIARRALSPMTSLGIETTAQN